MEYINYRDVQLKGCTNYYGIISPYYLPLSLPITISLPPDYLPLLPPSLLLYLPLPLALSHLLPPSVPPPTRTSTSSPSSAPPAHTLQLSYQ